MNNNNYYYYEDLHTGEAVPDEDRARLDRSLAYLDYVYGLKPIKRLKDLPHDCGIYYIHSKAGSYVGATTTVPQKKRNNFGYGYYTKNGISKRFSVHTSTHTEAGDLARAIDRGETAGAIYVLGLTTDTKTASQWESFYIDKLNPTINKSEAPKPSSGNPAKEVSEHLVVVGIGENRDGMPQSVYMWTEEGKETKTILRMK